MERVREGATFATLSHPTPPSPTLLIATVASLT